MGFACSKRHFSRCQHYWKNPKYGLPRPPLNDTTDSETALHEWGKLYGANVHAKHEAREKNNAKPMSSLSAKTRRKMGV